MKMSLGETTDEYESQEQRELEGSSDEPQQKRHRGNGQPERAWGTAKIISQCLGLPNCRRSR